MHFDDGSTVAAHAVVLATGVSYRSLGAPGCAELTGRGVYYGSALTEAANCADQDVYIVGGANSAGQAAVYLARSARSVTLLVRGDSLQNSMSYYLTQQLDDATLTAWIHYQPPPPNACRSSGEKKPKRCPKFLR